VVEIIMISADGALVAASVNVLTIAIGADTIEPFVVFMSKVMLLAGNEDDGVISRTKNATPLLGLMVTGALRSPKCVTPSQVLNTIRLIRAQIKEILRCPKHLKMKTYSSPNPFSGTNSALSYEMMSG
jgi:hypothetical protein